VITANTFDPQSISTKPYSSEASMKSRYVDSTDFMDSPNRLLY